MNPLLKFVIEFGPLIVFFGANAYGGIFLATKVFMVVIVLSLGASYALERRLPMLPLVTAGFVLVFGGLTLFLNDETFIKLKPTIVNILFAVILFGGLALGKSLVKPLLAKAWPMDDVGWRRLTIRWACFFVAMAILNEIVWRNVSTDAWVSFKVFGMLPITLVFSLTQVPLMQRHRIEEDAA